MTISKTKSSDAFAYVKSARNRLVFGLVCVIFAANSFLFMPLDDATTVFIENTIAPATALSATIAALVVVARQKLDGLFGRAYLFLALGLAMWCTAEIIWSYNVLIVGEESPFPSFADVLWLAAYAPFGYHMASMYRFYSPRTNKNRLALVAISVSAFTFLYALNIISTSEASGTEANIVMGVSLAYPILDGLILIPAILIILNHGGKGILTAIPWIFMSWILTAVADSLFGYSAVANLIGEITIWNLFYNAAYLCMAAGVIWHNKFFVIDEKRGGKLWAERNR